MPELYKSETPIAIFRGMNARSQELEVEVLVPDGSIQLPAIGEFLLIRMGQESAALARVVQAFPSGPIISLQGEGYLAELGKAKAEMPSQVREHVLRFTLRLVLLGRIERSETGFELRPGLRRFPEVGAPVFEPSRAALVFICNAGLTEKPVPASDGLAPHPVPFGHYTIGDNDDPSIEIRFDINRLKGRRSFVFARAGYGKSNLMKYLISQLYASAPKVGLLILDPEGEYATRSATVPGLADVAGLASKLHVFSQRRPSDLEGMLRGPVKIDFGNLSGEVLISSFVPLEKQTGVWANWIRSAKAEQIRELIQLIHEKGYGASDDKIAAILKVQARSSKEGGRDVSIAAILNNLISPMKRLHDPRGLDMKLLENRLREGHIVILDVSLLASSDARALSEIVLTSIFFGNVRSFSASDSTTRPLPCIAVFEEAQTLLGNHGFNETSIFVRWVKEGRKYDLGCIMITQQPGAISQQILSQGDNFFAMHLLNQADLDALHAVNAHFAPDILHVLRHEPIRGNCYFWSAPDQPYVVCARVKNFDDYSREHPAVAVQASAAKPAPPSQQELPPAGNPAVHPVPGITAPESSPRPSMSGLTQQHVWDALASSTKVYLYHQAQGKGFTFSIRFLARVLGVTEDALSLVLHEMDAQFGRADLTATVKSERVAILPMARMPPLARGKYLNPPVEVVLDPEPPKTNPSDGS